VIATEFERLHGRPPQVEVRSPGRVNLIGEHTDYSLLPVMPIAIDRGVEVAAALLPDPIIKVDSITLPGPLETTIPVSLEGLEGWHRYLAAAVNTLAVEGVGAEVLIGGDLPPTGGLSSSSAFTVGLLEALNRLWDRRVPRTDYPAVALRAERSIGIEGGMMDQTVISLARAGHAARIDFHPFGVVHVPLPPGLAIIAAYSGATALKGTEAREAYNGKVVACRAAALLLGEEMGIEIGGEPVLVHVARHPGIEAAIDRLPAEITASGVAARLGVDVDRMIGLGTGRFDAERPLFPRVVAGHVISEASRVDRAEEALRAGDLAGLGSILDASHSSLVRFGASSERLDRLVGSMRRAGAFGARLTGAGFGGYAVAVAPPEAVGPVLEAATEACGGPAFEVRASDGVH
jgi:galactokinase